MRSQDAYAGFALFGAFWGTWGASLPAIRDQAAVTNGQLGTALLFIGAGALPAMLLAGRAVDRWHERTTAALLTLLGLVGVFVVVAAHDFLRLVLSLLLLGGASGAADVAINSAAGSVQRAGGGPVVPRAHAAFSAGVVIASIATGAVRVADLPTAIPFVGVAAAAIVVAAVLLARPRDDANPTRVDAARAERLRFTPLIVIGGLGALAFAVENAHQSWSALYLRDVVGASAGVPATGPALFAAIVGTTRFATGSLIGLRPRRVIVGGAVVAGAGTVLVARAGTIAVTLMGIALAAAGTAVVFPTLIVVLTARAPEPVRGTATSVVTTVAYLGFIAGPAYVGAWADAVGLPGAMLAVAALALALAMLATVSVRSPTAAQL